MWLLLSGFTCLAADGPLVSGPGASGMKFLESCNGMSMCTGGVCFFFSLLLFLDYRHH